MPTRAVLALALLAALAVPARAQFATTEVSPPGSPSPLRITKTLWTWEDLGPGITYSIYRSDRPDTGFECILDRHPAASWTGDVAPLPPTRLFFYLVTAYDGVDDNIPGRRSDGTLRTLTVPCPRTVACCMPGGACQDLDVAACATAGGTANPPGTACATTACVESPEACCTAACCVDLTPTDCRAAGGVPQGRGTACATTGCPVAESCCLTDGSCQDLVRSACEALGGRPWGAGSDCASTTCATCPAGAPTPGRTLRLVSIGPNFTAPMFLTAPKDDQRLFVLERAGRIRIQRPDGSRATFLDFTGRVVPTITGTEMGALGLAFHPDYATNGLFYVHYSARASECGDPASNCGTVSEWRVSCTDPDAADPASERILLQVPDFASNHNGGWTAFGPDGMLYIAYGDGGGSGDPRDNSQDLAELLGKILRIDVDGRDPGLPYAIPPDNPFVGTAGARPEIWSYGVRNPWRNAFDRLTGDLYIADVGQGALEEVNVASVARGAGRGENYGWDDMEGTRCFEPAVGCLTAGRVLPDHEFTHAEGCSITGGYVYRGCRMPDWQGWYFFTDYCGEFIDAFDFQAGVGATIQRVLPAGTANNPVSFGEDGNGELYLIDQTAPIRRLEP